MRSFHSFSDVESALPHHNQNPERTILHLQMDYDGPNEFKWEPS